jgi:hypothetical protein
MCDESDPLIFLVARFFSRRTILSQIPCSSGKKKMKKYLKGAPKIGTTTYNMKACLSFFYFDIFKHRQISLNFLMNDRHFNNISH